MRTNHEKRLVIKIEFGQSIESYLVDHVRKQGFFRPFPGPIAFTLNISTTIILQFAWTHHLLLFFWVSLVFFACFLIYMKKFTLFFFLLLKSNSFINNINHSHSCSLLTNSSFFNFNYCLFFSFIFTLLIN